MTLSPAGYVSIAELIVYIPALIAALVVTSRHGLHRASGWIYTIILCGVRIGGAVCQLLTYHDSSTGLLKAVIIIDSIGISPLLLATLGVLSRFVDWINSRGTQVFGMKQFRLIQLLITLGLILSIAGGTSGSSSNGKVTVSTTAKVGVILYIIAFAGITFMLVISSGYRTAVPIQERRSPVAIAIAWPLIFARLTYSTLAIFLHNNTFSVVGGDVGVSVGLAVVEEWLVVIDYLILGFNLQKLEPEQQGELANRQWKDRRQQRR
ncbi:hypothetical protein HDV63DRAFT_412035 [Trichoderma sp. SZMC 28014]